MMNITLLAAQAALADTLAGGNPVLTPVSEEARMNLWDMAMKGCLLYTSDAADE